MEGKSHVKGDGTGDDLYAKTCGSNECEQVKIRCEALEKAVEQINQRLKIEGKKQ